MIEVIFMRVIKAVIVVIVVCMSVNSWADCFSSASHKSKAISKLWAIPEVNNWRAYVFAYEGKKPIVLDEVESVRFKGKCLLKLDAYSDEGDHLHRWHSFYIHPNRSAVYIDNSDGQFISLSKWRSTKDGKSWRTNNLIPKS